MLYGLNQTPLSAAANNGKGADFIFDATSATFEKTVLAASMDKPVLVDFWAPWCGPCKQLMPVLEQVVAAQKGQVILAKVNVDENPELAQAFQVQSVPMVVALFKGQPVTAFAGVQPKGNLEQLMAQLIQLAQQNGGSEEESGIDPEAALQQAAQFLEQGELGSAQNIYAQILQHNPQHDEAYAGIIRVMIAAGDTEQAQAMADAASDDIKKTPSFAAVKAALELAQNAAAAGDLAELENKVAAQPDDLQARFDLAEACFTKGQKEQAVDALIEIIRRDRGWDDEKAKTQLLKYFESWGFADPASVAGRRKLSSILFS